MVFSSASFLFLFFPVAFIGHLLMPRRAKNLFLFIMSLVFYGWGDIGLLKILLSSIVINYVAGLLIDRSRGGARKAALTAGVAADLGILGYFKYAGFFTEIAAKISGAVFSIPEIVLPIGISFYTFQAISYLIDVYRGEKGLKNPIDLGLYIALFPQLIAGPIVRYGHIKQYLKERSISREDVMDGFERFLIGLCKKVLLANSLAVISGPVWSFAYQSSTSVMLVWIHQIAFALQIYFDFSGYSDMAIGLGRMFGFRIKENFDHPYCAPTITDFWRRWHISLYSWFRDYVYIPLGGSRKGTGRYILNLFIVWALSGLWHGASWHFVVWGISFFVLMVTERHIIRPERFTGGTARTAYRIIVLACVVLTWVMFQQDNLIYAKECYAAMFGLSDLPLCSRYTLFTISDNIVLLAASVIFTMPVIEKVRSSKRKLVEAVYYILLFAASILAIASVLAGSYDPFLYFMF